MNSIEIRANVTATILNHIKKGGLPPWRKRWVPDNNAGSPCNFVSKKSYTGCNILLLNASAATHEFDSRWFGTFKQFKEAGATVKRRPEHIPEGKWGTRIVYVEPVKRKKTDDVGVEQDDTFLILKSYVVFNLDQVEAEHLDHLRVGHSPITDEQMDQRYENAATAINAVPADIRHGGDSCFYNRSLDFVQLPHPRQFHSQDSYFSAASHELVHWSESRLNWDRETEGYPMGELIAEIGSSFFMAELGLRSTDSDFVGSSSYLESWLRSLKNDPSFILKASAQASRAVSYLFGFSRTNEPVLEFA